MSFSVFDKPTPPPKTQSFILGLLLLGIIAVVAAKYVGLIDFESTPQVIIDDDDDDDVVTPTSGLELDQCMLLVIRDKASIDEDIGYTETMVDDEFWQGIRDTVKDVEIVSPNDDVVKPFLEQNQLTTPIVCLIDTRSKKVLWHIPLPKGGTDPIKERLSRE